MTVVPYPTLGSARELFFPPCYEGGLHIDKWWPCALRCWGAQYVDSEQIAWRASRPWSAMSSRKFV